VSGLLYVDADEAVIVTAMGEPVDTAKVASPL
jgi:hypothetical protein